MSRRLDPRLRGNDEVEESVWLFREVDQTGYSDLTHHCCGSSRISFKGMASRSYIHVRWLHSSPDEPVELWSELDEQREETRKVEIWADGRVGYASANIESGGSRLGECGVPAFEQIENDPEFEPKVVTQFQFEEIWAANAH